MTTLVLEREPIAVVVQVTDEQLIVHLTDGRTITAPIDWYPRLVYATVAERNHHVLLGHGSAIGWPDLDEHLSVESILAGRPSGESQKSLKRWLSSRKKSNLD